MFRCIIQVLFCRGLVGILTSLFGLGFPHVGVASVSQEPNGQSFSLKKTSICRAEFHSEPYAQRGAGYTLRVAGALCWLRGMYGDSPGDLVAPVLKVQEGVRSTPVFDLANPTTHFC